MSFFEKLGVVGALAFIVALVTLMYGWAVNIYDLCVGAVHFDPSGNWVLLLLRAVGVFVFPLGGALGIFL